MADFKDHFSGHSADYHKYRPHYPDELFDFIKGQISSTNNAWDVGTGNGQCAVKLADFMDAVLATDPSANQIKNARAHGKVRYHVSAAEACPVGLNEFDLITVAQAMHWFDLEKFFN